MATGKISDFLQNFTEGARQNKFEVIIGPILGFNNVSNSDSRFFCENAQLPGRNFLTMEQRTYGPARKFPYQTDYGDVSLTFIVDDKMGIKTFFDNWMDLINPSLRGGSRYFNINYKEDYSTTITITQFDVYNNPSYTVNLWNAFPTNVNQLDLDWSSEGFHKLNVTFAYDYWIVGNPETIKKTLVNNTEQAPT